MDKITKQMCTQLRNNFYGVITEEISETREETKVVENQEKRTFTSDSNILSGFIDDIYALISTTPISFNELEYYPNINEVKWSGTIGNGLKWATELGADGKSFFLNIDNVKVQLEETRALLKLHAYFDSSWVSSIREAIKNKDLSKKEG